MSTNHREDTSSSKDIGPIDAQHGSSNNQNSILPVQQPENVITPRQERARRYLERKRARQERLSQQLPVVKAPSSLDIEVKKENLALPALPARVAQTVQLELAPPP